MSTFYPELEIPDEGDDDLYLRVDADTGTIVYGLVGTSGLEDGAVTLDKLAAEAKPVFNARDYGATPGTGGATNLPAVQAAVDAAYTAGGGTVFLPPGTYPATSWTGQNSNTDAFYGIRMKSNVTLIADGATLVVTGGPGVNGLGAIVGNDQDDGAENIAVVGLTIDLSATSAGGTWPAAAPTTAGMMFGNVFTDVRPSLPVDRLRVERCTVLGSPYLGIQVRDGCTNFDIVGNHVEDCGYIGIQAHGCQDGRIDRNVIIGTNDNAIDIYGANPTVGRDIDITRNRTRDVRVGVFLETVSYCSAKDNDLDANERGVYLNRIDAETVSNDISGNRIRAAMAGILVQSPCYETTIVGNTIELTANGGRGIDLDDAYRGLVVGNLVRGNGVADDGVAVAVTDLSNFWTVVGNWAQTIETTITGHSGRDVVIGGNNSNDAGTWPSTIGGGSSDPTLGGDLTGTASAAQIAAGAVGTTELAAAAVTLAKLDPATTVTVVDYAGSWPARPITGGMVVWRYGTTAPPEIADGDLWIDENAASGGGEVGDPDMGGDLTGTASNAQIASGVIVNADISGTAAIALSKLATDPLARANHTGTQLASTISDFSSAVAAASSTLTANVRTGNYTLVLSDAGTVAEQNSASATTVTVPPNSSVAFPVGTVIEVFQAGVGQVTIAPGSGVTLQAAAGLKTRTQFSSVSLRKRSTDVWAVAGDTVA